MVIITYNWGNRGCTEMKSPNPKWGKSRRLPKKVRPGTGNQLGKGGWDKDEEGGSFLAERATCREGKPVREPRQGLSLRDQGWGSP